MKKILIIGSLNMDMVVRVDHHPITGETILGSDIEYFPGGKGANQAYAAAALGGDVVMLGAVGSDDSGEKLINNLKDVGVDVSRIKVTDSSYTGTAFISVNEDGDNSIIVVPGANKTCVIQYIDENSDVMENADYVLLQMEIPLETIRYIVEKAALLGKTVILNPAPAQELDSSILSMIDYLTPNESELALLSGVKCDTEIGVEKAAKKLIETGVKNVIVTVGDKGAAHFNSSNISLVPGYKVKAVDTTAAGDCFNGAFTLGLAEGLSVDEAIAFANKAASISVTRVGAQASMPMRSEVVL